MPETPTIDEIMSGAYDPTRADSVDIQRRIDHGIEMLGRKEFSGHSRTSELLIQQGHLGQNSVNAEIARRHAVYGTDTSADLWEAQKGDWFTDRAKTHIAQLREAQARGQISPEFARKQIDLLTTTLNPTSAKPGSIYHPGREGRVKMGLKLESMVGKQPLAVMQFGKALNVMDAAVSRASEVLGPIVKARSILRRAREDTMRNLAEDDRELTPNNASEIVFEEFAEQVQFSMANAGVDAELRKSVAGRMKTVIEQMRRDERKKGVVYQTEALEGEFEKPLRKTTVAGGFERIVPSHEEWRLYRAADEGVRRGWNLWQIEEKAVEDLRFDVERGVATDDPRFRNIGTMNRAAKEMLLQAYVLSKLRNDIEFGLTEGIKKYQNTEGYARLILAGKKDLADALVSMIKYDQKSERPPVSLSGFSENDSLLSVNIGIMQGTADIISLASRLVGQTEYAGEVLDFAEQLGYRIPEGRWYQTVGGTMRTISPSILGAAIGGAPGFLTAIGTASLTEMNHAVHEAEKAGLEGVKKFAFVMTRGIVESGIASIFQGLNIGGVEKMISQGILKTAGRGFLGALYRLGVTSIQELGEEIPTEILHAVTAKLFAVDADALSSENLVEVVISTTTQTLLTVGLMGSPGLVASPFRKRQRAKQASALAKEHGLDVKALMKALDLADIAGEKAKTGKTTAWGEALEASLAEQKQKSLLGSMVDQANREMQSVYDEMTITPRVDVSEMGKGPKEPTVMPRRKNVMQLRKEATERGVDVSDIKGKGAADRIAVRLVEAPEVEVGTEPLTPEEYGEAQRAAAEAGVVEHGMVSPNLYIGNVTARMKRSTVAALNDPDLPPSGITSGEVDVGRIPGFMDQGVPTKRTKVDLTADEARTLLYALETDLQRKLDNNEIDTHADMAKAKANWGDIRELRTSLGMDPGKQPFRIIKEAQRSEVVTIENVAERVRKSVTKSQADEITITRIDRLNQIMRRVSKAAREGHVLGKKEVRKLWAESRYLKRVIALRKRRVKNIMGDVSEKVDPWYRMAIETVQGDIDAKTKKPAEKRKKESTRQFVEKSPDRAGEIPEAILDSLDKPNLSDFSDSELEAVDFEVRRLKMLGTLKHSHNKRARTAAQQQKADQFVDVIEKAKKQAVPLVRKARRAGQSVALRPWNVFDMLDGGKALYDGPMYEFFWWEVNKNTDAEIRATAARQRAVLGRMNELGITTRQLGQRRQVAGLDLTVDEYLSIYAKWQNTKSKHALYYGGVKQITQDGKTIHLPVTEAMAQEVGESLTQAERQLADTIIADYQANWDRIRFVGIKVDGHDSGVEDRYSPMVFEGEEYKEGFMQQLAMERKAQRYWASQKPESGFLTPREAIPDEYAKPLRLGLMSEYLKQSQVHEYYAAHAVHHKDMRAIAKRDDFKMAVIDKFGKPMMTTIDHYINSIGNPSFYKAHGDMEALSKQLRSNTAIVWIALKSITVLKQAPSLAFFMTKSNPNAFFKACRDTVDDPIAMYEKALEIFPQLSKPMEREIAELYEATDAKGIEALHKMGRIGFYPVKTMDRFVKTVGILAVYESHGGEANHEVAARKAAEITLRTQPAALPKDLARLYTSHEFLNWSVMFTNQLNQIWNIGTYEVPAAIKDGRIMSAIGSMVSLGAAAVGIWSITNGEIPDEPEDIEDALYSQITSSMPLFGRYIEARRRGFDPDPPAPFMAVVGLANAVSKFAEGDFMGAAEEALFPAGVSLGLPIGGAEDLYDWLDE